MKASLAIAAELRGRIARGEFAPGDPLPAEHELTAALGYSKPVVREALRILETEGLIEVKRGLGGGPRIRQLTISEAAKPIGMYLQIGDVPVIDVWTARDRIVASAVERLAAGIDVSLDKLQERVDTLTAHVGDFTAYYKDMIDTAETAVELAGNATDYVVVVALRHVIEVELAAATDASADAEVAVTVEQAIAEDWRAVLRHIRGRRPRAARAAYDRQAQIMQEYLERVAEGVTVGELVSLSAAERSRAHSQLSPGRPPTDWTVDEILRRTGHKPRATGS